MALMKRLSLVCILVASVAACGGPSEAPPPQQQTAAAPQLPLASMPKIDQEKILEHVKVLSSDEFEGRAPGTKGEGLTVTYIQDQFKTLNLKPGNPDGTFVQNVPLVGIVGTQAKPLTVTKGAQKQAFKWADEVVAWTKHVADGAAVENSDVVFAGYGVEAPEFNWNDFKDVDVKGNTILVLVNDPAVPDPSDPSKLDPKTFKGDAMTYYGRWT